MHRNITSVTRHAKRIQRTNLAINSHAIMKRHQHPDMIPAWAQPDPWVDNWIKQYEIDEEMERRNRQHGNELAVKHSLRALPTRSATEAMQMADLLDFAPNREVKHRPRMPRPEIDRSLDSHFDRECAACGEFHPTEEHQVTYVHACNEEHAYHGFGRWRCPNGCQYPEAYLEEMDRQLDYAV